MSIGPLTSVVSAIPAMATPAAPAAVTTTSPAGSGGGSFAESVGNALANLDAVQQKADGLGQQVATGQLRDVHDYMIASTEASVATELTLAVRNKVVEAFNQIMQMPI